MNNKAMLILTVLAMTLSSGVSGRAESSNKPVSSGRNDVVCLAPAINPYEAMPIGNGRLGAMVWNENGLTCQLNNGEFFVDDAGSNLLSSGRIVFRLPDEWLSGFISQKLILKDAAVETRWKTASGNHMIKTWIAEGTDLLVSEITSDQGLPEFAIEVKIWPHDPAKIAQPRPPSEITIGDDDAGLTTIGLSGKLAAPLLVKVLDVKMKAERIDERTVRMTVPAQSRKGLTIFAAAPVVKGKSMNSAESFAGARKVLSEAVSAKTDLLWRKHCEWWKAFWNRSMVLMSSPDGLADFSENMYYIHLYCLGSSSRATYPAKFNGANFIFYEDYRSWNGKYWHQNTREVYWPLLAANQAELWKPFLEFYWNNLPVARDVAKKLDASGAAIDEVTGIDGTGTKLVAYDTMFYHTTGTETAWQFYQYYLYTRDEDFLRERAYPFMKEVVTYHLNFVNKEADGLYHVYPSSARETWRWIRDSSIDMAALRATLPVLIHCSEKFNCDETERAHWKDVFSNFAPFVRDAEGIYKPGIFLEEFPPTRFSKAEALISRDKRTVASVARNWFNFENVELETVYPWSLVGLDSPQADLQGMRQAYLKRKFQGGEAWDPVPVCAARIGLVDEAAGRLRYFVTSFQEFPSGLARTPGGRPKIWFGQLNGEPGFDGTGVMSTAIQEMQLQSLNNRLRIYPCWPKGWQGEFSLMAEGALKVDSVISGEGVIQFVRLQAQKPGVWTLVNPWPDSELELNAGGSKKILKAQPEIKVELPVGVVWELHPKGTAGKPLDFKFTAQAGPKWHQRIGPEDTAEAFLKRRPPNTFGFIGITKDGQDPARMDVEKASNAAVKQ